MRKTDLARAQVVLLADARATVTAHPPEGDAYRKEGRRWLRLAVTAHPPEGDAYLRTLGVRGYEQLLRAPEGWNFHDLAAAEYLLREQKRDVPDVQFAAVEMPIPNRPAVRANWKMIVLAVAFTGGIYGLIIGLSLVFSRQDGNGTPYHYDEFSRNLGVLIFTLTMLAWGVAISLMAASIINPTARPPQPNYHYHRK